MTSSAGAAVITAPGRLEIGSFDRPAVGEDSALLDVELCALCGSDVELFQGVLAEQLGLSFPFVPGHEFVGMVGEIGERAARRWGVSAGDRVVVQAQLQCDACEQCRSARPAFCTGDRPGFCYGMIAASVRPGLWGGLAERVYLDPHSVLHRVPDHVPAEAAVTYNAVASGVHWAVRQPGTRAGETVVILGPGPRGLSCVIAAREAGAGCIIVTGLGADRERLDLARALGADATVDADELDPVDAVRELTAGRLADVVVDVSSLSTQPVLQALGMVRPRGRVVLAGLKNGREIAGLVTDQIVLRELRVLGTLGPDYASFRAAMGIIAAGKYPLGRLSSHVYPLESAERALRVLAREVQDGAQPLQVAVRP